MNRPKSVSKYKEVNLKLAIKSSLPDVKSVLGLTILFWISSNKPSNLIYSKEIDNKIVVTDKLKDEVKNFIDLNQNEIDVGESDIENIINSNRLFLNHYESLMVAFDLIWKITKINFTDINKTNSAERNGGVRYSKTLNYTSNMDIIGCLIDNNTDEFLKVILNWCGFKITYSEKFEKQLEIILTAMSEEAVFKLDINNEDLIFHQNGIYQSLLENQEPVDIKGDKAAAGSLRILKSLLKEQLNPYLKINNNKVDINNGNIDELEKYQKRVENFLKLKNTNINITEKIERTLENEKFDNQSLESDRIAGGVNILLYGVPGSGKSWTISNEYIDDNTNVERLVFHPEYAYSDFIGQIMPNVDDSGQVSYIFVPGPFTKILKNAYLNPTTKYLLIIEEINRGNAPSIFGEVFQLLDRVKGEKNSGLINGTSIYGINNKDIAKIVYGDESHPVRIPSNLSIIATMNTSDQNVFTLDTAFQRRWEMRLISNKFDRVNQSFANKKILDTSVTWRKFCTEINSIILKNSNNISSSEDKRMGVYFVNSDDLRYDNRLDELGKYEFEHLLKKENVQELNDIESRELKEMKESLKHNKKFPEKVLKYLWDDAFKFNRNELFDTINHLDLESIISVFIHNEGNNRFNIFKREIKELLIGMELEIEDEH